MTPILVTGGGKGIGREICRHLAQGGHDLVIHYRKSKSEALHTAEECLKKQVAVETLYGDFTTLESLNLFIATYLDRFPESRGIVNNVGDYLIASLKETPQESWLSLFQSNLFAPIFLIQALLPSLIASQGSIVNLGVAGLNTTAKMKTAAYAAAKSALLHYTRSLAKELASEHVRVNMVSPGYTETSVDLEDSSKPPFGRSAYLSEVAYLVATLFSKETAYITGQNIEVAGGVGL